MASSARLRLLMFLAALAIGAPSFAADEPPAPPPPSPINIIRWRLLNPYPCVKDTVVLVVAGYSPTPCDSFVGASVRDSAHVVYHTFVRDSIACALVLPHFYPVPLRLGRFSAGPHRVDVLWLIDHLTPSGRTYSEERHAAVEFSVSEQCPSPPPPPPPGPLPFVDRIVIGRNAVGDPPRICPRDSIPVLVLGHFPSDCFRFRRIELLPDLTMNFMQGPPRVRIIVDDGGCLGRPCAEVLVPWQAFVKLGPLPRGSYMLPVELAQVSCSDSFPPGQLFRTALPFVVLDSCGIVPPPPPAPCLTPLFDPRGLPQLCDARIGPDRPAKLWLYLKSPVPLSGLQGELALSDSALHIGLLELSDNFNFMTLLWERTPHGARFVLFDQAGAAIPPTDPTEPPALLMQVTVVTGPGRPLHPVTLLAAREFLGSDPAGHGVPQCPPFYMRIDQSASVARICLESGEVCDWNGDARADIRDLVLMLRCLNHTGPCPDSLVADHDCNRDREFDLDDVLCCADSVLFGHDCERCPDDSTRVERGVKVAFGLPIGGQPRLDLPIRIEGADPVGGARLVLRYPQDRYDLAGVEYGGVTASWLHLSQARGGEIVIGLIHPGGEMAVSPSLDLTLQLALKPGATPGGEVSLDRGEFTGHDGVRLAVEVPRLALPLAGPPRLSISESRPNPFAGETRFGVALDRPGHVEVGIYDLTGRAVVMIFRGDLPAGMREFGWNGRRPEGAPARDGIYFIRAVSGDGAVTRKLVLLRR